MSYLLISSEVRFVEEEEGEEEEEEALVVVVVGSIDVPMKLWDALSIDF